MFCELYISFVLDLLQYTYTEFENTSILMPDCLNNNGNLLFSRMGYVKKTRFLRLLLHRQIK